MNLLDVLVVILVIAGAFRGAQVGFSQLFFALTGFWSGIIIGVVIATQMAKSLPDAFSRLLTSGAIVLISSAIFSYIGQFIGLRLARITHKYKLASLDSILGSAFTVFVVISIAWLLAAVFSGVPYSYINKQISGSSVVRYLNNVYPPAPGVLSRLGSYINPEFFPRVFTGSEPQPIGPVDLPDSKVLRQALKTAGPSVVRIESAGCGGLLTGSGFVADTNLVITNAHVIAGVSEPTVVDKNGRHSAVPVMFDPVQDIAVLRTQGDMAGRPLPLLSSELKRSDTAITLGYPGGGPLVAEPAGVLSEIRAVGRDIYHQKLAMRDIYQLQTKVFSGNSGGPIVLPDGTVAGVVFAKSEAGDNVGYALTSTSVRIILDEARNANAEVSTRTCTR